MPIRDERRISEGVAKGGDKGEGPRLTMVVKLVSLTMLEF